MKKDFFVHETSVVDLPCKIGVEQKYGTLATL